VAISAGAGAVATLVGVLTFGGITALVGTSLVASIGAGAIPGIAAGQSGRLTGLALSGQISQVGSTLFRPKDILLDGTFGGLGGAINYGINRGASGIAEDVLQYVTDSANRKLTANPALARNVLSPREYAAGQTRLDIARMQYGDAQRNCQPSVAAGRPPGQHEHSGE